MVAQTQRTMASSGYKQTEIGIIPEDWKFLTLGEFTTVTDGTHYSPPKVSNGFPLATVENIKENLIDIESCYRISKKDYEQLVRNNNQPEVGDILFTKDGTVGKTLVYKQNSKIILLSSIAIIRKSNKMDSDYCKFVLQSQFMKEHLAKYYGGTAIKRIILKDLSKFEFPSPLLPEQKKIAGVLSDTDNYIEKLKNLITKKKNIKQGVMQELLTGKLRLEGFNEKWESHRLEDTFTLKARIGWQGLTTSEYLNNGNYFLVTGTDFNNGVIDWDKCHHVEEKRYSQDPNIQLKEKDVLITKDGTIGKIAFVAELPKPATLNSGVFVIRPKFKEFEPLFFYYILCSRYFKDFLNRLSAGSTISHLYQKDFINFEFPLPLTKKEQSAIAQTLFDMDSEIKELEKKKDKYFMIKNGMMQKLLTGEIRLK